MSSNTDKQTGDVPFSTAGWTSAEGKWHWRKPGGGELRLTTATPSTDGGLQDEPHFRDTMRQEILRRGGGLVSADLAASGANEVGSVVAKFPQQPHGMTYEGNVLFLRGGVEYRVTASFPEAGMTGLRDTAVMMLWMNDRPADADPMEGWMLDPYDRARRDPLMRNVADDQTHDAKFPEHPLTLVRLELRRLQSSLTP